MGGGRHRRCESRQAIDRTSVVSCLHAPDFLAALVILCVFASLRDFARTLSSKATKAKDRVPRKDAKNRKDAKDLLIYLLRNTIRLRQALLPVPHQAGPSQTPSSVCCDSTCPLRGQPSFRR